MLRAVLFDLGDTLIDFAPLDRRAVFDHGARLSYRHLSDAGHAMPSYRNYWKEQYRALRWAVLASRLTRREFNSLSLLRRHAERNKWTMDEPALEALAWTWYQPLLQYIRIANDVIPTLTALHEMGLKLALVSNTFVPAVVHDRHLRDAGLLELLPVRVYSSEVGRPKPHRRMFQQALTELGLPAEQALFVGDTVNADIVGARRIGMRTVLRDPLSADLRHSAADFVIRVIGELLPIVQTIISGENAH